MTFDKEIAHDYLRMITVLPLWFGSVWFGRGVVVIGQYPPPPPNPPQWDMDSNARKAPIGGEHFSVCSHWSRDASPRVVGQGGGVQGRIFCFRLFSLNRDTEILGMITVRIYLKNP